jgi:citrate lyase beta subunit
MQLRSILFVPADSEKKIVRSMACGADALVLDLEDSAAPPRKSAARRMARAIHPSQVEIINRTFAPSDAEIAAARAIVAAYDADPDLGTFQLDGRMIDIPHLKQAQKLLAPIA